MADDGARSEIVPTGSPGAKSEPRLTNSDYDFDVLVAHIGTVFKRSVETGRPILLTRPPDLYQVYLRCFPNEVERQIHTCSACGGFLTKYGGLVIYNSAEGCLRSVLWDETGIDGNWAPILMALRTAVESAKIHGPLVSSRETLGVAQLGGFPHFHAVLPRKAVCSDVGRRRHELETGHQLLIKAMKQFKLEFLNSMRYILDTDVKFRRCKKFVRELDAYIQFRESLENKTTLENQLTLDNKGLDNAQDTTRSDQVEGKVNANANSLRRGALLWDAVVSAPTGSVRIANTVLGVWLSSRATARTFTETSEADRQFINNTRADVYQRPVAAPAAGNVAAAERLVQELDLVKSLERRYATLEDVQEWVWQPSTEPAPAREGVFAHLKTREQVAALGSGPAAVTTNGGAVSWTYFFNNVLPMALKLEFQADAKRRYSFSGLVTAVHPDAKPILAWDAEQNRNPVSHYTYLRGSLPYDWSITGKAAEIIGICKYPYLWNNRAPTTQADGIIFLLKGVHDRKDKIPLGLFNIFLRPELHGARAVIESFSNEGSLPRCDQEAAGVGLLKRTGQCTPVDVVATVRLGKSSATGRTTYTIDRWE